MAHPGICCLRSNTLDQKAETMWRTCVTPTDAEAAFLSARYARCLPRSPATRRIPALSCQAVQILRATTKMAGFHGNLQRATITFKLNGGKTLRIRRVAVAGAGQTAVCCIPRPTGPSIQRVAANGFSDA